MDKEGADWVVKGVRFTHGGEDHVVKVSGEVIVCGGSVSSPQLLELSGIGEQISEPFLLLYQWFEIFVSYAGRLIAYFYLNAPSFPGFLLAYSIFSSAMYLMLSIF